MTGTQADRFMAQVIRRNPGASAASIGRIRSAVDALMRAGDEVRAAADKVTAAFIAAGITPDDYIDPLD